MKYYKYKMNAVYFNVFASILIVLGFLLHYCLFSNYIMEGSFLVYMVLWMFLHEILHGIGFMCFKEVSNKNVVFGAKLEKGVFYCMCKQLISKKIILTALLAPLVLIGIITLIIAIIFNLPTLALLSLFNISGAIGDIMMSIMFFNMPFDIKYTDLDECDGFVVLSDKKLKDYKVLGLSLIESGNYSEDMVAKDYKKVTCSKTSLIIFIIIVVLFIVSLF